ncbi:TetR/AcrR family transcriptional regulator [Pseudonocardia broussonetiae]|uniref:TetR family transcriptional regulator n=1 Tax=Pseudonocardia broussonetiae TaxID=2736640 RepID=A0A6M6JC27_9PSEU|nr:TetR/AcrR family transcriptional regulator [Pseudonocardia broussonetiae]QJY45498.1 TetR family transcriptional regulator [Pseudonocardia broussonetiae]
MPNRRTVLLDAAIEVLGERGVRAVTHRAVDAEAGVGAGSTANYFPTRDGLFAAIVERFAEREGQDLEELVTTSVPGTPAELGRTLATFVRHGTTRSRTLTLCRCALLVESANNPDLREHIVSTGQRVGTWFTAWLRLVGSTDPALHVHVIGNYLTGLTLHQLAMPDPHFDPTDRIVALLESLIPPPTHHPTAAPPLAGSPGRP